MTTIISFLFFLAGFTVIGILSAASKKSDTDDYLLASRSVNPYFTALSAVATNNSGFMFIGLIGYTYKVGLSSIWIMVGWIAGDYLAWRMVYKNLRDQTEQRNVATYPSYLGYSSHGHDRPIMILAGLIIILLLGTYAGAQLKAGSKALHELFSWPYSTGAIIGAVIVLVYSWSGGIRASIWTDVAQSIVMIISMLILVLIILYDYGGFAGIWKKLYAIDPSLTELFPKDLKFGFLAYLLSWTFAGLGVAGQPHVVIRAMAIRHSGEMKTARKVYFLWYIAFSVLAIFVGLASRIILTNTNVFDAELALPSISMQLLPPVLVGLVLAGLFAATMSTADSQVLSCSAALSQDIFTSTRGSYFKAKIGTLIVTILALIIALFGTDDVFTLVVVAWSVLASGLGPITLLLALRIRVGSNLGIVMILGGIAAALIWRFGLAFHNDVYEVLPGMLTGFAIYGVLRISDSITGKAKHY